GQLDTNPREAIASGREPLRKTSPCLDVWTIKNIRSSSCSLITAGFYEDGSFAENSFHRFKIVGSCEHVRRKVLSVYQIVYAGLVIEIKIEGKWNDQTISGSESRRRVGI
ncbi:MAG TPA: hypothetical protein PLS21_08515, partial [Synergistales bacterium]|nr:hypothetical protein [Synergistales bacterium]